MCLPRRARGEAYGARCSAVRALPVWMVIADRRHGTRRFTTPTDSVAAARSTVAPEMFRAITRTVLSPANLPLSAAVRRAESTARMGTGGGSATGREPSPAQTRCAKQPHYFWFARSITRSQAQRSEHAEHCTFAAASTAASSIHVERYAN